MTEQNQKKLIKELTGIVVLAVILSVLMLFGVIKTPSFHRKTEIIDNRPSPRNAFDIALPEAQKWQSDAKMVFLNSIGPIGETGRSNNWGVAFASKNVKGKVYLVNVVDYKIISAGETLYTGSGADFPENIISLEEAIKQFRQIKGNDNIEILGAEAIYGPALKVWYWGIKTPLGVTSVKAAIK